MAQRSLIVASTNSTMIMLLLFVVLSAASSQAAEPEFRYEKGSPKGPEHWGAVNAEWALCAKGRMQSPVDIAQEKAHNMTSLGPLQYNYKPAAATVLNEDGEILLKWKGGAGNLRVRGKLYVLQQLRWHLPSEHTFNGVRYDLEMHMIHHSSDGKRAVVAILFSVKGGIPSTLLPEMEPYIKHITGRPGAEEKLPKPVDPRSWMEAIHSDYYRYDGSFTTPPCTEGVVWTVMGTVMEASQEHVKLLKAAMKEVPRVNSRPTQQINDRVIGYYGIKNAAASPIVNSLHTDE